jgi:hypothetical protein
MINSKDINIFILLLVGFPFLTLFVAESQIQPSDPNAYLLLFVPLIPGLPFCWNLYRRYRKMSAYVQQAFEEQGLYIQKERPLSFWESYEHVMQRGSKPVYWPLKVYFKRLEYKTRFHRVFTVLDADYKRWEVDTIVTFSWKNEAAVEVKERKALS